MQNKIRGFEVVSEASLKKNEQLDCTYQELLERIKMPRRGTKGSAGYDLFNNTGKEIIIKAGELSPAIPTYVKSYMQQDEVLQIHVRGGHGFKYSVRLANSVGIADADFFNNPTTEGHLFVKFHNQGTKDLVIQPGEAFAQAIFTKYLITDDDADTVGGDRIGGFGSTST